MPLIHCSKAPFLAALLTSSAGGVPTTAVAAPTVPRGVLSEDYETGQTVGQKPTGAAQVLPATNTSDQFAKVVSGNDNSMGSGNAVQLFDNTSSGGINLEYNFVNSAAEQVSAVRIDFSLAPLSAVGGGNDPIAVGIGEYNPNRTFSTSANRFIDMRMDNDGTVDFRGPSGAPFSNNNALLTSSNRVSIFANDFDSISIDYTGPDNRVRTLPANSVAYWLNGLLVVMSDGGQHTSLDVGDGSAGGTVGTSERNLGKFGFNSLTADIGIDYLIDDIVIAALDGSAPPGFTSDPIIETTAAPGAVFNATLADKVTDPDGGTHSFSRVSGPAWLSVAANGVLSGTPSTNDLGANVFVVQVSDSLGGSDQASLKITVAINSSSLVFRGISGRLVYKPDEFGDRIPDFSGVGYRGGGIPLPDVASSIDPSRFVTVHPGSGDDQAAIQTALDTVSAMTPDAQGFRGVVQLVAGEYVIPNQVTIRAGGVILRGQGDGTNETVLRSTATSQVNLISAGGTSGSPATVSGTTRNLIDKYVPVGATSFRVDSTAGFSVGDDVIVKRPSTTNWISDLGMDVIPARTDGTVVTQWTAGSRDQTYERTITRIEGDRVFIDAPLPNSFEQRYGGGTIYKYTFANRLENIGIENLRGISAFASDTDENHAWTFVDINRARNCWVRNITAQHFGFSAVLLRTYTSRTTCDDLVNLDPKSIITGGRRYAFNNQGGLNLMKRMMSENGRHDFVNNAPSRGPNVFFDGVALGQNAESGPHQRWSTGSLYDNLTVENHDLAARNRGNSGTGHGWSGANMVYWNCVAKRFLVENPFTAQNWVVGGVGERYDPANFLNAGPGEYDSHGQRVSLGDRLGNPQDSLYLAQLNERLVLPRGETREYVLGDFDGFIHDGGGSADEVAVEAAWQATVQTRASASGWTVAGFDETTAAENQATPFTFDFALAADEQVVGATLTVSLQRLGGRTRNDSVWLDSLAREIGFAELGLGAAELPATGGQVVPLEILGTDLELLQDGRLNVLIGEDAAVDWATLALTVNRRTESPQIVSVGRATGDTFQFQFNTITDIPYRIEQSADLQTWDLADTINGTGNPATFVDPGALNGGNPNRLRFYRVVAIE
jgi:hypothetical protein